MNLLLATEVVLQRVQSTTGRPVEIVEDAEQQHLARMTRARDGATTHLLRTNPTMGDPNYLIVYECGFVLRQFDVPTDNRVDFAPTGEGRREMERLVKRAGQTARLPEAAIPMLVDKFFTGLLVQLRSLPIGMRIDTWIRREFPDLLELQREAAARQQSDNLSVLKPEVKQFAPKGAYDPNATMNAAHAVFCDRVFGNAGYVIPWRSAGYDKAGRKLLDLMDSVPADPASDRKLVDAWAEQLGLDGWYQWVPMRP